jgi:TolB-like protein/tetratricopeptide (TPR) repeat protein
LNLIAELKRRNVIRMAGLYLVGAWLLTQVASTVLPAFDVPGWVLRGLIVTLLIGFIPALVFAWVFELTPQGLKRDADVKPEDSIAPQTARRMDRMIIAALMLALVYFGFDKFVLVPAREAAQVEQRAHAVAHDPARAGVPVTAATPNSMAVLAFDDLSPAHDQGYFSDGMAEEILNALARIKALKVVGRSSSFQFKGRNVSPEDIGAQLGVAHLLEGSVRKQGEQLRITATLVQAIDGVQQWSKSYDGRLANVFDLQESCAHDIATQLKVVLAGDSQQRLVDKSTDNADAYALFVEAQTLVNVRVGDSLPQAIALLHQATALDPKFARAWSKLAVAQAVLPQYVPGDWSASWQASDSAAQQALSIDPAAADAWAALSYNQFSQRHYVAMAEPMGHALALAPDDSAVSYWAANQMAAMGRTRDAEARIDSALVNDPANILLLFYESMLRWRVGDDAGALAFIRRGGAVDSPFGALMLSFYDAAHGDLQASAEQFAKSTSQMGSRIPPAELDAVYRGSFGGGAQRQAALKILAAHADDDWTPTLLLQLAEPARAFDRYEHGRSGLSDAFLNWLWQTEAWSRKARRDPAFQGFAQRLGMVDYWKRYGWPDLCAPTPAAGVDTFACQ